MSPILPWKRCQNSIKILVHHEEFNWSFKTTDKKYFSTEIQQIKLYSYFLSSLSSIKSRKVLSKDFGLIFFFWNVIWTFHMKAGITFYWLMKSVLRFGLELELKVSKKSLRSFWKELFGIFFWKVIIEIGLLCRILDDKVSFIFLLVKLRQNISKFVEFFVVLMQNWWEDAKFCAKFPERFFQKSKQDGIDIDTQQFLSQS